MHKNRILCLLWLLGAALPLVSADERPVVSPKSSVYVQYQYQNAGSDTWTTSSTTLKGATSESTMKNQISQRHPGKKIRILSAKIDGKSQRVTVKYQYRRGEGPWNTSSTTLQDALTESMARNQLSVRHPGQQIRILSMTP
ncbi:MAG: hypothetical protein II943_01220 [Victivallales bacterium]|nr:hypothetical protein [Victivallales bacterium]